MCISNKRLLPLSANNGDTVIFNSTTMRWEVGPGGGLPIGTNEGDIMLWDEHGEEWIAQASPFASKSADETILGDWSFDRPVHYNGQVTDPTSIASPSYGFVMGADMNDNLFYLNSIGGIIRYRTSSISSDVTYTLPNDTGTIALKGKTGIHFDSDADLSASLQVLKDPSNNSLPLKLSTTQVAMSFAANQNIYYTNPSTNNILVRYAENPTTNAIIVSHEAYTHRWLSSGAGSTLFMTLNQVGDLTLGGSFANAARLHVRGSGSNDVFRVESSDGYRIVGTNSATSLLFGESSNNVQIGSANAANGTETLAGTAIRITNNITNVAGYGTWIYNYNGNASYTTGTGGEFNIVGGFAAPTGTANYRPLNIAYTINNSGAQTGGATATGIFLNATETGSGLNGMTHTLIDLQKNGTSQFKVTNNGEVTAKNFTSDNLSSGTLSAAKPVKFGDRASITEAGLTSLGLDRQIAIEHNNTIYYIAVSQTLIS